MQLENSKSLGKVETGLKEGMNEIKRHVEKLKEEIDDRIEGIGSMPSRGGAVQS